MRGYRCYAIASLLALGLCNSSIAIGAGAATQNAIAAIERQDFPAAEQLLRAQLKLQPNDAETLSLLGIALDQQRRFPEAREFHRRAVAAAPRSTAALYNFANSMLAAGDEKSAQELLLRAIAVDPADRSANLALAQLAVNRKDGAAALTYLDRLQPLPETAILRLTALDLAGKRAEAGQLFAELSAASKSDPKAGERYGWALLKAGQFDQAETLLSNALAANPSQFEILYGLGVAAGEAGHNERAKAVLDAALKQQPANADVLYALAVTERLLSQPEEAIRHLAEAARLDPKRADVQKLLAISASEINAHEDAVAAWDRYLKLVPGDDEAFRERAFAKARLALLDSALPDLKAYTARHPDDATGLYELGMAQSVDDPEEGIRSLDRAIALKPDFVAAHASRGMLLYTQSKPEAAVPDLEFALSREPVNSPAAATTLDRLGEAYRAVNRVADAVAALRRAAALSPGDSTVQLHLANALAEAGDAKEADALMAHFREMRPGGRPKKVEGVVDYLSMTPEQRHGVYQARLEKAVQDHPEDVNARLLYLKYLLAENRTAGIAPAADALLAMKPGAVALAEAGHALLIAGQYAAAKKLLEQAAAAGDSTHARLDLARAAFHAAGSGAPAAQSGLGVLDMIPSADRDADYFVARAEMLDASGHTDDALAAMRQALHIAPLDSDLYCNAAAMMAKGHRIGDALAILADGERALPREPQLPVSRAVVLLLNGDADGAQRVLDVARPQWPEFAGTWVAQAMVDANRSDSAAARKALETAVALGSESPEVAAALASPAAAMPKPESLFFARPPRAW